MNADSIIRHLERRAAKITQKQLASDLGVSPAYLNDVIQGRREPGRKILAALKLKREVRYVGAA